MQIAEKFHNGEGDKFHIERVFDNSPYLKKAEQLRQAGAENFGESKVVGVLPAHLFYEWLKEAGVDPSDKEAAEEVLRRKMLSGDFDKLRVWKGTY